VDSCQVVCREEEEEEEEKEEEETSGRGDERPLSCPEAQSRQGVAAEPSPQR